MRLPAGFNSSFSSFLVLPVSGLGVTGMSYEAVGCLYVPLQFLLCRNKMIPADGFLAVTDFLKSELPLASR